MKTGCHCECCFSWNTFFNPALPLFGNGPLQLIVLFCGAPGSLAIVQMMIRCFMFGVATLIMEKTHVCWIVRCTMWYPARSGCICSGDEVLESYFLGPLPSLQVPGLLKRPLRTYSRV